MPRFRILAGGHDESISPQIDKEGNILRAGVQRFYRGPDNQGRPGDVFDSEKELDKMFNAPGSVKFERVSDDTPLRHDYLDQIKSETPKQPQQSTKK